MNLWQNKNFSRFFISFTIGNVGDWLDVFALQIILSHNWNASPINVGLLLLFYLLPAMLFGSVAGAFADKHSQRNIMLFTDAMSALLTLGLFFCGNIFQVFVLVFARSVFASFNSTAQQAYIKHIVSDEQLLKASSYTSLVFQLCKIIGPTLGAGLLFISSAKNCLLINAFSFAVSTLVLIGLPKDQQEARQATEHWRENLTAGFNIIWQNPLLRVLVLIAMSWLFTVLLGQTQLVIFLRHVIPNQPEAVGFFMGLDGLGAGISAIVLGQKEHIKHPAFYFLAGFLLLSVGTAGMSLYQSHYSVFILYGFALIAGLGTGMQVVVYSYLMKAATAKEEMGRVAGASSALQSGAAVLGTFLSGFLVVLFGVRTLYVALAVVLFLLAIWSFFALRTACNTVNAKKEAG